MSFKLGELIGSGGYAQVYRALDPQNTPLNVAIKKSRASTRLRRTHLKHEVHVLQLLRGHPAIPRVVAYGHLEHFEYLALELLGQSLNDVVPKQGMEVKMVARIAVSLLSALEFVHSHGLLHRDIKPSNVLLTLDQPPILRLIDFGIARPFRTGIPARREPTLERLNIAGTLDWASLNAHLGYDSSPRDDLESLAYTLLFLLRGGLPWQRYNSRGCTRFGAMKQIREKKMKWPGPRLGEGKPKDFGNLLDYARALAFEDKPDYKRLSKGFERLAGEPTEGLDFSLTSQIETCNSPLLEHSLGPAPVTAGELVYVQIHSRLSVEGVTAQATDASHWDDPSFSEPEWQMMRWPAVVLNVKAHKYWSVMVLPLRQGAVIDETRAEQDLAIRVSPQSYEGDEKWPWEETVAYACPLVETFTCLPDQPIISRTPWFLSAAECTALLQHFSHTSKSRPLSPADRLRMRIRTKAVYPFFSVFSPMVDPLSEAAANDVAWHDERGWLDELARVVKRRTLEAGWAWSNCTTAVVAAQQGQDITESSPSDSNMDPDMSTWWPLGGRDVSVTLDSGPKREQGTGEDDLDPSIMRIDKVIPRDRPRRQAC